MADATLTVPADPVVGLNIRSVTIRMRPRVVHVVLAYEHESGAESRDFTLSLAGERANAFLQSWMQAAPVRKMLNNLIEGGELSGVAPV